MEKNNIDEDMEHIFGKLKKLRVGSTRSTSKKCPRKVSQLSRQQSNTEDNFKQKDMIHKTLKTSEQKPIVREGRLKLSRALASPLKTAVSTVEACSVTSQASNNEKLELQASEDMPVTITRSCSIESRNAELLMQGCKQDDFDNTTPSELAGYLEQILHFPKPMSAMAEMMYG
eukprot:gene4863-5502_t